MEENDIPKDEKCGRCGGKPVFYVDDRYLCEECYQIMGSCCLEFGEDDLWKTIIDDPDKKGPDRE